MSGVCWSSSGRWAAPSSCLSPSVFIVSPLAEANQYLHSRLLPPPPTHPPGNPWTAEAVSAREGWRTGVWCWGRPQSSPGSKITRPLRSVPRVPSGGPFPAPLVRPFTHGGSQGNPPGFSNSMPFQFALPPECCACDASFPLRRYSRSILSRQSFEFERVRLVYSLGSAKYASP